jgi:hypothetical protein
MMMMMIIIISKIKFSIRLLTPWSIVLLENLISHSASQQVSQILWNLMAHYHVHKNPPMVSTLGQMNPVHILTPNFFKIHFIISPLHATCFAYFILLDLIILIFGEE